MIIMIVAELLTHIFLPYGLVDATKIAKEEQKVSLMVWNINNYPVIVYNEFKELVALSKVDNLPKTRDQITKIGVEMIRKNRDFETGFSEWFERPAVEYMCQIFKSNFKAAYTALKQRCGTNLRNTAYHQADQMAAEINTNFERMRYEVLTRVHALVEFQSEDPPV